MAAFELQHGSNLVADRSGSSRLAILCLVQGNGRVSVSGSAKLYAITCQIQIIDAQASGSGQAYVNGVGIRARNLQDNQTKCHDCLTAETKHVAHILDTNISLLLTTIVSRLVSETQQYKNAFLNVFDEESYDISFAKQYKKLLIQDPGKIF
ncbi:unnamed protein product [Rotaria sp. Silwood2]|nr:unnamed protein product [Rotaria sp. Silwood2]CAF2755879.1 unnamed protein product [Rotaria sp. Silwood2]CAF4187012.1 unnamed protein product [Rotaria sp. Silwood2]CAF4451640.1 unnamed protein product [Rotaria sp. Silwood2]